MHFPLLLLLPLLPLAHPSPPHPLTKRIIICDPTPSPHLRYTDCIQALRTIMRFQPCFDHTHPPLTDATDAHVVLTEGGHAYAPNGMPLSVVAGTCRVYIQLVTGAGWNHLQPDEVLLRATSLIARCVGGSPPRGGHSAFRYARVAIAEVGPAVRAGVL